MPRIGIDLSPTRCHLVEVCAPIRRRPRIPIWKTADTQVLSFETIPHGWAEPSALTAALQRWLSARKRNRHAWVALWGLSSAHQLLLLPAAKPSDFTRLAQEEAARDVALLEQTEVVSGMMLGASRGVAPGSVKREVTFVAASAPEVRAHLQPLIDAGFVIEGVATPPLALSSLARLRRGLVPGAPVALLALGPAMAALAIVRDGLLLFAREMPWGHLGPHGQAVDREQFTAKLAGELRRSFLFFKQTNRADVTQIVMCGDAPDLRRLTAPLIMALDLEVETLDSLDGLNPGALPQPTDVFREQVAKFRLAWAMAADGTPPINLAPPEIVRGRLARRQVIRLTGGLAAAVMLGLIWYGYPGREERPEELNALRSREQIVSLEPAASTSADSPPAEAATVAEVHDVPESNSGTALGAPAGNRSPARAAATVEETAPAVADPVVRSILYSAGRRAALIDNRIVAVGDRLSAGRVIAIEREAVIIETSSGERRRLALRRPSSLGPEK